MNKKNIPKRFSGNLLLLLFIASWNCLMAQSPGASLGIASLPNLRDIGGYKTKDSVPIRKAILYRSSQLTRISSTDMQKIAELKLKNDFDLRTTREREAKPDELPTGVRNASFDMLADASEEAWVKLDDLLRDPKRVSKATGGGTAEAELMMKQIYCDFVTLPSAKTALKQLYTTLAQSGSTPALVHCSSGKDRTGWAIAALLTLLEIPKETVIKDFVRSNEYILPAYKKTIDDFVKAGGEPGIPTAILGVKAIYLDAAFNEVQKNYGTIERYFSEGLGVDAAKQKALKAVFLEKNS